MVQFLERPRREVRGDQQGSVIATLSQKVKTCPSAEMIEARAAKRAI